MTEAETSRRETAGLLGLVGLGGAIGTLARYLLSQAFPESIGFPAGILIINIIGAFALGVFIAYLAARGTRDLREKQIRLFVATGVLGGFTTYSAFATDSAQLMDESRLVATAFYVLATILIGGLCSWVGILAGQAIARDVSEPEGDDS